METKINLEVWLGLALCLACPVLAAERLGDGPPTIERNGGGLMRVEEA